VRGFAGELLGVMLETAGMMVDRAAVLMVAS